jgi:hypothetical protein
MRDSRVLLTDHADPVRRYTWYFASRKLLAAAARVCNASNPETPVGCKITSAHLAVERSLGTLLRPGVSRSGGWFAFWSAQLARFQGEGGGINITLPNARFALKGDLCPF